MKKTLLISSLIVLASSAFAKKVMFMVDMDTITPNVNGIHITGDFQSESGFGTDWDPATTQMTQVGSTSIYKVVVDIPAFRNYEFKFVNGIFGYEVEFVPWESRVLHNFNDNRWIYIDSLANDTQIVKPVIYGMNAPAGKHLLRFRVDMRNVGTVSPLGVHVAGAFQGWDPTTNYMYSFDGNIHDFITYVDTGIPAFQHEYKFYNGETGTQESVPITCANGNGNRGVYITKDSILDAVCFSQCSPCVGNSTEGNASALSITVYPNPSSGQFTIQNLPSSETFFIVYDVFGKQIYQGAGNNTTVALDLKAAKGIYCLRISFGEDTISSKLVIE